MTNEELEKKAENSYWDSEASGAMSSKKCYVVGYIAGAKEMQEENEQLKQQIEKMKSCANCPNWLMNLSIQCCDTCKNKDVLPIMNGS